jgi:hypothetical protein
MKWLTRSSAAAACLILFLPDILLVLTISAVVTSSALVWPRNRNQRD